MAYVVKALAQIGMGVEVEEATATFDLVFANCDPNESCLLLLVKAITLFTSGRHKNAILRIHNLIAVSGDEEATYCYTQVLGKMYLMLGDYSSARQTLDSGHGHSTTRADHDLEMLSFIFKLNFDALEIAVQQFHCESLMESGCVDEAANMLLNTEKTLRKEIDTNEETRKWHADFKKRCIDALEYLGDTALSSGDNNTAIAHYSSALSLDPPNRVDILVKRSEARASKQLWKDSLADANEVIKLDPLSHEGHVRKHVALHGAEDYHEAVKSVYEMFLNLERSQDEKIRRLRENYTHPRQTTAAIDTAIKKVFQLCPLVLIDVSSGELCNAEKRIQIFKSRPDTPFKRLISETVTTNINNEEIFEAIRNYFQWVMFSHTWQGEDEPKFRDLKEVGSVKNLDKSPLNEKLRGFCLEARKEGYRWVWSDTCCIDQGTEAVLRHSLLSMYTWYAEAAATFVYLADVLSESTLGDLTESRWMTRAWTLQELLASRVIRFYTKEWKRYLNDEGTNHKDTSAIKEELARALRVPPTTIVSFQPKDLGVREKLRLASKREAKVPEDVAYSLIGILSSDIIPQYGEGEHKALGHLLEDIVARTKDVKHVIDWTGKSSPYNSALPASLGVYSRAPYCQPDVKASELETLVEQLRSQFSQNVTLAFYDKIIKSYSQTNFSHGHLHLPCVAFSVESIVIDALEDEIHYRASVPLFGQVEFRSKDKLQPKQPQNLVFVHPWLRDLGDPANGFLLDGEAEIMTKSNANPSNSYLDASVQVSARVDRYTHALRLIARLERPFNALLLEKDPKTGFYKRVATEHEFELEIQNEIDLEKNTTIRVGVFDIT